ARPDAESGPRPGVQNLFTGTRVQIGSEAFRAFCDREMHGRVHAPSRRQKAPGGGRGDGTGAFLHRRVEGFGVAQVLEARGSGLIDCEIQLTTAGHPFPAAVPAERAKVRTRAQAGRLNSSLPSCVAARGSVACNMRARSFARLGPSAPRP